MFWGKPSLFHLSGWIKVMTVLTLGNSSGNGYRGTVSLNPSLPQVRLAEMAQRRQTRGTPERSPSCLVAVVPIEHGDWVGSCCFASTRVDPFSGMLTDGKRCFESWIQDDEMMGIVVQKSTCAVQGRASCFHSSLRPIQSLLVISIGPSKPNKENLGEKRFVSLGECFEENWGILILYILSPKYVLLWKALEKGKTSQPDGCSLIRVRGDLRASALTALILILREAGTGVLWKYQMTTWNWHRNEKVIVFNLFSCFGISTSWVQWSKTLLAAKYLCPAPLIPHCFFSSKLTFDV